VFKIGDKIDTIRIKGKDKSKGLTDEFIIPVVLPSSEKDSNGRTIIEPNENCIRVELIHKSPIGNSTSAVNCSLPITIDSVTKKYVIEQTADMRTYEKIENDGRVSYKITYSSLPLPHEQTGLQLTLEDIIINQKEDADDGYLPDVVRAKGYVSINSSLTDDENVALSEVGSYELRVTTNNGSAISEKQIFVYEEMLDGKYEHDASDGDMTATVNFVGSSTTKWVSGIEYYTSGKMNVTVDNIRYTQPYVTKNTNRIKLEWSNSSSSKINTTGINNTVDADVVIKKGTELTPKEQKDTGLSVGSVFTYKSSDSKHNITTTDDVGKFSVTLNKVYIYKQDGNILAANVSTASATSDKYIWQHTSSKPNDYTITFNTDNDVNGQTTYHRYLNAFDLSSKQLKFDSDIVKPEGDYKKYEFDSK
jgi:hypothetical protein